MACEVVNIRLIWTMIKACNAMRPATRLVHLRTGFQVIVQGLSSGQSRRVLELWSAREIARLEAVIAPPASAPPPAPRRA